MYFYERFLEKLSIYEVELKKKYKFTLSFRKKIFWIFLGCTLSAIGIKGAYDNYQESNFFIFFIFLVISLYGIFSMFYYILNYKIYIDLEKGNIIYKKNEIAIEDINSVILKIMIDRKKVITAIQITTNKNIAYIFPLVMNNKIHFVYIFKKILGNKFIIEKPE